MVQVTINGVACQAEDGALIINAAAAHDIYIPTLCHHPDLQPFADVPLADKVFRGQTPYANQPCSADDLHQLEGCGLCLVQVQGLPEPVRACQTPVASDMVIHTESETLKKSRRANLMRILAHHPHACLTCAQREGCSLEDCSSNVPKEERCCPKFHDCELRRVAEYVGVKEETPRYRPAGLPVLTDEPLFSRDFNLCIDCARCVRACNQVRGVEALGIVHHNGALIVGSVAPSLIDSGCKFCGACVEVCPTGCLTDSVAQAGPREDWLVPCVHACPAGVDVPEYIRRIAASDFEGAAAVVWEKLPLANVLGHICFHLCEPECRRGRLDDPIAICALKRFALEADNAALLKRAHQAPDSGKKVAVVGAGPAGLSAASFLRFKGHGVTVFEATDSPGGMPALSIPEYRLPQAVLDKDLTAIRQLGVQIETQHPLATPEDMLALLGQGFDALLVAVGLPKSKKIEIEGSHLVGVFWGLEFLREVKQGARMDPGRRVVVVGGGNVAIDVAMTALRLSSGTARLFCLESREQMPAYDHEVAKAEAEGIEINPAWGPAAILGEQGKVRAVEFRRCLSVFDKHNDFSPTFDEQERMTVDADAVILAIGQAPSGTIPTKRDGVFLAGDVSSQVAGGGSAVQAVASGRAAAEQIDRYLGGDGCLSVRLAERATPSAWIGPQEGFVPRKRVPLPCAAPDQRCTDFRQIEITYATEAAVSEARRCLQCDLRLMMARPERPPEKWQEFRESNVERVPAVEGVFILADAERKPTLIKGAEDVHAGLMEKLESGASASFFLWEEDRMYTKKESELIQQHLKRYGQLPGGGDDELDDLF